MLRLVSVQLCGLLNIFNIVTPTSQIVGMIKRESFES